MKVSSDAGKKATRLVKLWADRAACAEDVRAAKANFEAVDKEILHAEQYLGGTVGENMPLRVWDVGGKVIIVRYQENNITRHPYSIDYVDIEV